MVLRTPVDAPVSGAPRVGLLASAIVTDDGQFRWETGVEFAPETCVGGGVRDPCASAAKTLNAPPAIVGAQPYFVWAGDRCSSWGFDARDYVGRARRTLEACESRHVAHELWAGTQAQSSGWPNRRLASPASDVVNPTNASLSPLDGLGCLEQGLAQCACGGRGMIHATRQTVTYWDWYGALRREGGYILTIHDTIVVPDAGYDGSGPDGEAPTAGSVWAYATGIVTVRRSPVEVVPGSFSEALDRVNNVVEFRAERLEMATWDGCCHLAVELDISACGIGGS